MKLQTTRLLLSPLEGSDLDAFTALHAEPDVTRYLSPPRALTAAESFRLFAQILGHWQLRGYGYWALRDRERNTWLGMAGLWFPLGWPQVELGWRLLPKFWSRGFAREAGQALLTHAFENLGREEVISIIHADNTRSLALAQRLNLHEAGRKTVAATPLVIYSSKAPALDAPPINDAPAG